VLFVLVGMVARHLPGATTAFDTAQRMMVYGIWLNLVLCFFNLIPIPPLDGSWVLMRFLPLRHIIVLQQFRLAGMALVVALLSIPVVANTILYTPLRFAVRACLGLFGMSGSEAAL
jgi:Zn-dependent protease